MPWVRPEYTFNVAASDDHGDWPKRTLDFRSDNVIDLRAELAENGVSIEDFIASPAYKMALASGRYDWLSGLAPPGTPQ